MVYGFGLKPKYNFYLCRSADVQGVHMPAEIFVYTTCLVCSLCRSFEILYVKKCDFSSWYLFGSFFFSIGSSIRLSMGLLFPSAHFHSFYSNVNLLHLKVRICYSSSSWEGDILWVGGKEASRVSEEKEAYCPFLA